jgi:hypothetical protein
LPATLDDIATTIERMTSNRLKRTTRVAGKLCLVFVPSDFASSHALSACLLDCHRTCVCILSPRYDTKEQMAPRCKGVLKKSTVNELPLYTYLTQLLFLPLLSKVREQQAPEAGTVLAISNTAPVPAHYSIDLS